MDKILRDLVYLNYRIYGTIIYLGHADFCPSTVASLTELKVYTFLSCGAGSEENGGSNVEVSLRFSHLWQFRVEGLGV